MAAGPESPPRRARLPLPRLVYVLGAVSFATDLASEMIVPLLPALLATLGGSLLHLGLLQGVSDLVVAALKIQSGRLSDRQRRRRPWILFGYGLSSLARPLFAVVATPLQALLVRVVDRVGKGLRSAPRDALLTAAVPIDQRGHAFGVQRSLDHAGALAGALVASGLLALGWSLRTVFAFSLLPGLAAVALIGFAVRDIEAPPPAQSAPEPLRRTPGLTPALGVVALSAISGGVDLFALAHAERLGVPLAMLPLLWAVLHTSRSLLAAPLGKASDRLGRKRVLALGLAGQALVLVGFAAVDTAVWCWPLFLLLGLHAAFTEGAERGLIADLTGQHRRGTAFGIFHAVQGLAAFTGASLLGALADAYGLSGCFLAAAAAALLGLLVSTGVPARSAR